MHYRTLGTTGIKVSEVSFGCWTLGGPNFSPTNGQPIGWAQVNEADVLQGIRAGLDAGVNHWDNADVYGNGRAERLLASCFAKLGVKRETQVIATKVGHFRGTAANAYQPHHIRRQCEQSLRNLRTDHIDLYYFHHATYAGEDDLGQPHDYLHEAADTMHALVREGKVRAIGQSAYSEDDYARAIPVLKPHVCQSKANLRYDDLIRPGSRLQALMAQHGCTFVAFGPLDQGILLDKFDPAKPPAWEEGDYRANRKDFAPGTLAGVREKLARVVERFAPGERPDAAARTRLLASVVQRWVLAHERVCCVIPGFRNAAQASCNARAGTDAPLSADDVAWLRGLFHAK
jgi:aryl-alcohol dehydrogenase-like predicted oxidoreductase